MPKPTVLPEWNSDGTNRTTPSAGQQDTGWISGQKPPSSYFNWWMYYVYMWLLWLDGILTADGGMTALANQHITVSGTGRFKHGDMTTSRPPYGFILSGTPTLGDAGLTGICHVATPIDLPAGKRIRQIVYTYNRAGAGTITFTLERKTGDSVGANFVVVNTTTVSAGTGWTTSTAASLDLTILAGWHYHVRIQQTDASNQTNYLEITYDHP